MRAFIMHPLLQGDSDFNDFTTRMQRSGGNFSTILGKVSPRVLVLVLEYRSVANEYLAKCASRDAAKIRLSPLKEVNDMLIADKVQNRKDFDLFHARHHENRERLGEYFRQWLAALHVNEASYAELKYELLTRVYCRENAEAAACQSICDFITNKAEKEAISEFTRLSSS